MGFAKRYFISLGPDLQATEWSRSDSRKNLTALAADAKMRALGILRPDNWNRCAEEMPEWNRGIASAMLGT
jgi:hypothetical protein